MLHCHCLVALLDQPPDIIIKIPVAFEELIVCVCKLEYISGPEKYHNSIYSGYGIYI